ncbi:hypothetical protein [Hyphomonas oceanitis]|uniref:hypothetical protein n=1 Tax=Hyphomonas oceanitis TaxID=81033 RepID=UPI00300370DB
MNPVSFDFGNAMMHFRKTGGPKGFLLSYGATYVLLYVILSAVSIGLQWPIYGAMFDPAAMEDPMVMEAAMMQHMWRVLLGYVILIPLGLGFWIIFEGASQRRYMRAEGFRLRLGGDEWRLLVVGLIWFVLFIGLYLGGIIAFIVPMAIAAATGTGEGAMIGGLLTFVLALAYMIFALWLCARFSPAAALTVRDRRIRFGQAWRVTKGKAWTIVGSWIVLGLIMSVVFFVIYMIFAVLAVASLMPMMNGMESDDPSAILRALLSPAVLIPGALFMVVLFFLQGCGMHILSGPAALAARTDPEWADHQAIDDTFV